MMMTMISNVVAMMTILSSSDDIIAHGSQEFDGYEDPHSYSRKKPCFSLLGLCTSDGLQSQSL